MLLVKCEGRGKGEEVSLVHVLNRQNGKVRGHLWETETCEQQSFNLQIIRTDLFQHAVVQKAPVCCMISLCPVFCFPRVVLVSEPNPCDVFE